ncbi:MAG TPA: pyruvate kinase [Candidatus Limnocylindrales bacterium]|nr:pyruvate kinase [Candidatus Limnocylindrales bacterium]
MTAPIDAAPPPRRTKLVCTIGPATADRVAELVDAGMDVARLNFSHGSPASREAAADAVRAASAAPGRNVAILADLAGPKIRLGGVVGDSLTLEPGRPFLLRATDDAPGDAAGAHVAYPRLATDVRTGDRILLADGAVELRVIGIRDADVATEVVRGGTLRSRAGVSVPSDRLSAPALTRKDRADIPRVVALGADWVAQSFVRRADDVRELRGLLGPSGPPIVAKIETRAAVEDFDAILDAVDAVMIARGDLGVELPYEDVPIIQKQLVRRALDRGVPSIVATQMLESMVAAPRPTRAEASDVANAVFDGADAIMLSGETAIGAHPVLAAEAAVRIARQCEERGAEHLAAGAPPNAETDAGALAFAAVALAAAERDVAGIACYTRTGRTARVLAALRPRVPVFAFSADEAVVRRLALVHGVIARCCLAPDEAGDRGGLMTWLLGERLAVPAGSPVVFVASTAEPGTGPNVLEVHRAPG